MRHNLLIVILLLSIHQVGSATTRTVSQGMLIQKVIDKAEEGDIIQILPGEYNETISISTPGITLKGFEYEGEYTVLNGRNMGGGFLEDAIFIKASNVTLQDLKIHSYENVAIQASGAENLSLLGIDIAEVGRIGVAFSNISNSALENCQIRDSKVAGITLNDSRDVVIQESEVYKNAVGIDVKGSIKITLKEIALYHNGNGVVLTGENTVDHIASSHISIQYCRFIGNGIEKNEEKDTEGVGLFINGYDHVEVSHSYFESNSTYGIVAKSNTVNGKSFPTNHTYVHHNGYGKNGKDPHSQFLTQFPEATGGDILFDGAGERNQFQEKTDLVTWPKELVQELGGVHTEMMHFL